MLSIRIDLGLLSWILLNSKFAFLTRGETYSLLNSNNNRTLKLRSLKDEVVDSVGAGDIFHSLASVLSVTIKDNDYLLLLLIYQPHSDEY